MSQRRRIKGVAEEYLTIAEVAVRLKIAAKNQGVSGICNPVDQVKHLKSLNVYPSCVRTVPVGK